MPSRSSLGRPSGLDVLVVELGDQEAFGRPLHRHDVGQRAGGDDHAAGMHAQVVGLADECCRPRG